MSTANNVITDLRKLGTPEKAKSSAWFFKTDPGQYGHGDVFIGVTVPEQRRVVAKYTDLSLREVVVLLKSEIHECRLTGLLILTHQFTRADEREQERIVKVYLRYRAHVNNWDLVDLSAPNILGTYLLTYDRTILYTFARSKKLWERRIAIVATFAFIRAGEYDDTLRIAKLLLADTHDLIHKAVGWMLREVGKRSVSTEEQFLEAHAAYMPRTMLRYAIERFPEPKRKRYLAARSRA